jgi:hypothetical protein
MLLDANASAAGTDALGLVFLGVAILFYFVPSIVAGSRHTVNAGGVFVVNLLLGWTFIGWVIALAMAAGGTTREQLGARQVGPAPPQFSPDGQWWWNGREWVPAQPRLPR